MTEHIKKVLVTGGAGFIGSHLVRALLSRGYVVTVIDDLSVGRRECVPSQAIFIEGDIRNRKIVDEAIANVDAVLHLAARVAIRSSFEFAREDTFINVVGTANVLCAAAQSIRVRRVVTASSMAIYSDSDNAVPINELHPTKPLSPYGISKLSSEMLTHQICAHAGKESAVLRLFNTYGCGQTLSPYVGVVTIFVNKLKQGERPQIFGDGEQIRDFVHVSDVVQGFILALESQCSGETFNIGSGVATSVNKLFVRIRQELCSAIDADHVAPVKGDVCFSVADITKARNLLSFKPLHTFDTSISDVVVEILEE